MVYTNTNKYNARKSVCALGHLHDSKKEAKRCDELHLLEASGEIDTIECGVKFELVPPQYREVDGKRKCVERGVNYIADFTYFRDGKLVVEDVKGYRGDTGAYNLFVLKRKLMLFKHSIEIQEI